MDRDDESAIDLQLARLGVIAMAKRASRWLTWLLAGSTLLVASGFTGRPTSAAPIVIDFEDLPAGPTGAPATVVVNDQYADRGIRFNNPVALDYSIGAVAIPGFAHSGVKAIEQCYTEEFC